jgi:hypothetical protein
VLFIYDKPLIFSLAKAKDGERRKKRDREHKKHGVELMYSEGKKRQTQFQLKKRMTSTFCGRLMCSTWHIAEIRIQHFIVLCPV